MEAHFGDVAVAGGALRVASWGDGPATVLGIHGITASSLSLAPVARHLPPGHRLLAPDLRGRGASNRLPGPYGMAAHAADCAAVLDRAGGGPAVVVGESMGGYVAVVLAAARPDLVERLVLVDGGLPLPTPAGEDPDAVARAVLGPALERLGRVFASTAEYLDFWRSHPALAADWNPDVEAYVAYDLEPADGGFRSRVAAEAVRADTVQTLSEPDVVASALAAVDCPVHLLRATRDLMDRPPPLLGDEVVDRWRSTVGRLTDEVVADTNHYTLMLGDRGARTIAARVAMAPEGRTGGGAHPGPEPGVGVR
ncbi:MAG TPA: alpha/beta hydrolase [Acidimicrobiales bacterium]|nr:alpha/beta hydrolase [Acidimicrobiales bacterium]